MAGRKAKAERLHDSVKEKDALPAKIFISYRRGDSEGYAFHLWRELERWFSPEAVFYDQNDEHHLPSGCDWEKRLFAAMDGAAACIAVIGPQWLTAADGRGQQRLFLEDDVVRREVARALERHRDNGLRLFPALFGKAAPPSAAQLPENLKALAAIQGRNYPANQRFDADLKLLLDELTACPGMPRPRPFAGQDRVYHLGDQRLSDYFSDPANHLAALRKSLQSQGSAAVLAAATVQGMGGVGKTQLALKYSDLYRYDYAGVWWLRAETTSLLDQDCLACCEALEIPVPQGMPPRQALKDWLARQTQPWLLVYDNAEDRQALQAYLPQAGQHHVVITSRQPGWAGAANLPLDVWTEDQALEFLGRRLPASAEGDRRRLAGALDGLPLALEQACAYIEKTRVGVADYLGGIDDWKQKDRLLDRRDSQHCPHSVMATLSLAFDRLSPPARDLLHLCGWLAPEPIPEYLFTENQAELPAPLAEIAGNRLFWRETVAELTDYSLCQLLPLEAEDTAGQSALVFHRLTQAAIQAKRRDHVQTDVGMALSLVRAAFPGDARNPKHWPRCQALAPHAEGMGAYLAVPGFQRRPYSWLLDRLAVYLQHCKALYPAAEALLRRALELNRQDLGEEHPDTLSPMNNLADSLRVQGDLPGARALHEKEFAICRRVLGDEHPDTLTSMNNLATTLRAQGDLPGARALHEKTLDIRLRVLGEEHPDTLNSMNNLATTLRSQGDLPGARALHEKTLDIRLQVQGEEHLSTLASMNNLATTLHLQGDLPGARALLEKTLDIHRRIKGDKHPETTISASNLFATLREAGAQAEAQAVFKTHLAWLFTADPAGLSANQRAILKQLESESLSRGDKK